MSQQEINAYMKGHENTFIAMIEIISNHVDKPTDRLIRDLEDFNQSIHYQNDAMLDGLASDDMRDE